MEALLLSALGFGAYALTRITSIGKASTHGSGKWATPSELKFLTSGESRGERIVLGWRHRQLLLAPKEDNVLAFGVQRSGKTSMLAVPALLEWTGSVVATSTKEELVNLTGRHRSQLGPVFVFAPMDKNHKWINHLGFEPVTWNPINGVDRIGEAAQLADLLTAEGKASPSAHWYLSAANIISALAVVEQKEGGSLSSLLSRLNTTTLNGFAALAHMTDGVPGEILSGLSETPDREAASILSTARSSLSLWLDERVARNTSGTTAALELESLIQQRGTLYLVAPAEEAERCRPLFSALVASLLRTATSLAREQGGMLSTRLLLDLDEVANFARIPRLESYVSTGPGQGIQFLLCFHDLAQLEALYGYDHARTVWNNCRARVLLPGQGDLKTLELFSRSIGEATVSYYPDSRGGSRSQGTNELRLSRPLIAVDELRRLDQPLLLYGNKPPLRLTARRWDQVPRWRHAVATARASPTTQAA